MDSKPPYLSCPFCPSQSLPCEVQTRPGLLRYQCPSKHTFFIIEETPTTEKKED
jgi:hypothetical protein